MWDLFPKIIIDFFLVTGFSLLIGMEQKRHFREKGQESFGTDRTFTFIGILGFILASQENQDLFIAGLIALTLLLAVFYYFKNKNSVGSGMTAEILALLIYCMPLIVIQQVYWLSILLYVLILLLAELKGFFENFSHELDRDDFFTLSKFIIMSGVILPVLPHYDIHPTYLPVSPYNIWLAVVVISGISYVSYLLRKYIFTKAGLLLTGILGGLYSSTATTLILARNSKNLNASAHHYAGAILSATAMMYVRLFILILIFDFPLTVIVLPFFGVLFLISMLTAWVIYSGHEKVEESIAPNSVENKNPLEFKIALIFALMFLLFTFLTQLTLQYFGTFGLTILSYLVGFTDVTAFLLNLFDSTNTIAISLIGAAVLQAMFSNNILKMVYGIFLSSGEVRKKVMWGFTINIVSGLVAIIIYYWVYNPPVN